jgi:transcription-repair coupling factor (superfamily II helicase)
MSNTTIYHSPLQLTLTTHPTQRHDWGNLFGSSAGLVLSQAAQQAPLIVITPDTRSAQRLVEEIQFYADPSLRLLSFPDWETLPYDLFSPHQDIISDRLTTLYQLPALEQGVLILPVTTLMYRLAPINYVQANSLLITCGQHLNTDKFRQQLETSSYRCVSQVVEHGEFAVRGSLLDLFPMGSDTPYRIDLFDDKIDSIRCFDLENQRSQQTLSSIHLLPAREFPFTKEAITHFRSQWRTEFGKDPTRCPMYQDVTKGLAPAGIEYYLPLFFEQTQTLFDYLPPQSVIVTLPTVLDTAEQFWQEVTTRYELLRHDVERPILPPTKLFLQANEVFAAFRNYPQIHLQQEPTDKTGGLDFATSPPPNLPVEARAAQPLAAFQKFLQDFTGRILITAETTGRRESILELLRHHQITSQVITGWQEFLHHDAPLCLTVATLAQGLVLDQPPLAIITETQFFGERVAQRRLRKKTTQRDAEAIVRDLTELTIGAPVVHEDHGVGRYHGLVKRDVGGITAEFLQLEYANQDKLYVPVTLLHLISRFTGMDPERAPLHRLGTGQWEKAKRKAAQKVTDVAAELLDIYARRAARPGHVFKPDHDAYRTFANAFPFEETPDQQTVIETVLADMYSPRSMDRLVCGDVGFGKTEVAMRAAFIAVLDGTQVAVLVPTTLLAQQHHQNFQDRFADWPVKIEQLSRFSSAKKQKETLKAVEEGQVDIVIGTHKLLQDNIKFKQLGLVIIDEEHRFGVKQKERFKALRAEVDILTLTATPIPRSLNQALSDLRDLSVIATPPTGRLAVKTFVQEWYGPTIIEAITRELKRGGQVYFLHNDIDTIEQMAQDVTNLVPVAQVRVAHGQMRERELEQVMRDFYHRRFNVLVCTTIIETGIDVPTANTIIINRADKLGLAQLYQLRGRVGRSHHRAYAYLIVPHRNLMTKDAVKRIEAISALEELGMGFTLATHDLEIRGAGELLGSEQSGHLQEIGFSLYTQLIERAVAALKSGQQPELDRPLSQGTDLNLYVPALLPSNYLPDVHTRLILYKRIANAPDIQTLEDLQVEMIDRFGLLPDPAKALLKIAELKLQATPLGIRKIDFGAKGGYLLFEENTTVTPQRIVQLVQSQPRWYKFDGEKKLHLQLELPEFAARCQALEKVLAELKEVQ